jgi:hypothetical protein
MPHPALLEIKQCFTGLGAINLAKLYFDHMKATYAAAEHEFRVATDALKQRYNRSSYSSADQATYHKAYKEAQRDFDEAVAFILTCNSLYTGQEFCAEIGFPERSTAHAATLFKDRALFTLQEILAHIEDTILPNAADADFSTLEETINTLFSTFEKDIEYDDEIITEGVKDQIRGYKTRLISILAGVVSEKESNVKEKAMPADPAHFIRSNGKYYFQTSNGRFARAHTLRNGNRIIEAAYYDPHNNTAYTNKGTPHRPKQGVFKSKNLLKESQLQPADSGIEIDKISRTTSDAATELAEILMELGTPAATATVTAGPSADGPILRAPTPVRASRPVSAEAPARLGSPAPV